MISHYLSSLEGIDGFGMISTVLAIGGFIWTVAWAIRRKKNYLTHMAGLPLEGNTTVQETINKVEL